MPPVLVGRQGVIDEFVEGLENGAGAPGRLMLISGNRGYGKTVMLGELRREAIARGWTVLPETASRGMCDRLLQALSPRKARVDAASISPSVSIEGVVSASLGDLSITAPEERALTLRDAINARLAEMEPGRGIVFTVDEAQAASEQDMVTLATTLQHVIADQDMSPLPDDQKRGIAMVFAALPSSVDDLLDNKVLTFLRRAQKERLGDVMIPDVRDSYVEAVNRAGKEIGFDTAMRAARHSGGYPYLVQLVGYYMWRSADKRGSDTIEPVDVELGVRDAREAFFDAVCAPVYYGLRSPQRLFIEAMARDEEGPSRLADIARRCERSSAWASKYRASLIRERVIEAAGYGLVRMRVPHLLDFINEKILWREE
ncbi:ATP-binding protein [uncultured Parolsenella sp.]|uniref:ATP-binding protein n=1 Tax=uncultured Parolsenella sp. TaxID=2083008 RepID=UPI0025F16D6B|nr:ATP-binding protein [uncultured Parolsenella sp.]